MRGNVITDKFFVQTSLIGYFNSKEIKKNPLTPEEYELYRIKQIYKTKAKRRAEMEKVKNGRSNRVLLSEKQFNDKLREEAEEARLRFEEEQLTRENIQYNLMDLETLRYRHRFTKEDYKNPKLAKLLRSKFWEYTGFLTKRQYFKKLPNKTEKDYNDYLYFKHNIIFFKVKWEFTDNNGKKNQIIRNIPFCLKCFAFNEYYIAGLSTCRPKFKTLITKPILRPKLIRVMKWFYNDFITKKIKCLNPKCKNPIHIDYIFRQLTKSLVNIERYSYFLERNMNPTFLCCTCFDRLKKKKLNLNTIENKVKKEKEKIKKQKKILTANIPVTIIYKGEAIIRIYYYYNSMPYKEFERVILNLIEFQLDFFKKFGKINPITTTEEKTYICGYPRDNPPNPKCCTLNEGLKCQMELQKEEEN